VLFRELDRMHDGAFEHALAGAPAPGTERIDYLRWMTAGDLYPYATRQPQCRVAWRKALPKTLAALAEPADGGGVSFPPEGPWAGDGGGRVAATAMGVIALLAEHRYALEELQASRLRGDARRAHRALTDAQKDPRLALRPFVDAALAYGR
jgi:hypothetical protein